MTCYSPIMAYRSKSGPDKQTGKWPIVFNVNEGYRDLSLEIPCGKCLGCRLEYSRQWAVRCMCEAQMHEKNCFVTLTYSDDNVPADYGLRKEDFVLFMKRLRKSSKEKIKFFMCGEYGETKGRPHYHACLFNYRPDDLNYYSIENGYKIYTSVQLDKLWKKGYIIIGELNFESAAYVARYVLKKIGGYGRKQGYDRIDVETGEYLGRVLEEYNSMSRVPGLGRSWLEEYHRDVYVRDRVYISGRKSCKPPRYYDNRYEMECPENFKKIRERRLRKLGRIPAEERRAERRLSVERVKKAAIKSLKRKYEYDN